MAKPKKKTTITTIEPKPKPVRAKAAGLAISDVPNWQLFEYQEGDGPKETYLALPNKYKNAIFCLKLNKETGDLILDILHESDQWPYKITLIKDTQFRLSIQDAVAAFRLVPVNETKPAEVKTAL